MAITCSLVFEKQSLVFDKQKIYSNSTKSSHKCFAQRISNYDNVQHSIQV